MQQKMQMLSDKLVERASLSILHKVTPLSGHQVAAGLYAILDEYADAVFKNDASRATVALEDLAVEALRALALYRDDGKSVSVDQVRVEGAGSLSVETVASKVPGASKPSIWPWQKK
jgi:hypothetical protein